MTRLCYLNNETNYKNHSNWICISLSEVMNNNGKTG